MAKGSAMTASNDDGTFGWGLGLVAGALGTLPTLARGVGWGSVGLLLCSMSLAAPLCAGLRRLGGGQRSWVAAALVLAFGPLALLGEWIARSTNHFGRHFGGGALCGARFGRARRAQATPDRGRAGCALVHLAVRAFGFSVVVRAGHVARRRVACGAHSFGTRQAESAFEEHGRGAGVAVRHSGGAALGGARTGRTSRSIALAQFSVPRAARPRLKGKNRRHEAGRGFLERRRAKPRANEGADPTRQRRGESSRGIDGSVRRT